MTILGVTQRTYDEIRRGIWLATGVHQSGPELNLNNISLVVTTGTPEDEFTEDEVVVIDLISSVFVIALNDIHRHSNIRTDLHCDSLDEVELAMALEDTFNIPELSENDISRLITVQDVIDLVARYTK